MNNNTKEYGYIRVSSKTQNVARQIILMKVNNLGLIEPSVRHG